MHTYCNNSLINCYIHVLTLTLLSRIHENAFAGTIVNEFPKTGIFPLDPNVFPYWKHEPEDLSKISWNARKAGEEASQPSQKTAEQ
jgi:hypothetical protein